MKKKFVISYCKNNPLPELAGKVYRPPNNGMLVMNAQGIFFLYISDGYSSDISKLSDVIGNYNVRWK